MAALESLAEAGARVSIRVTDLDNGRALVAGDDADLQPIGAVGVVPLLLEVAAGFDDGSFTALDLVDRAHLDEVGVAGVWQHLRAPALPLTDLAVLAAATGDALAANALLERVGIQAVQRRIAALGLTQIAVLDRHRDDRGLDDAPHFALGTAEELTRLFAQIVNMKAVNPAVSAQVAEWLSLNHDLTLVGSATGLDPFAHDDDPHGLLFVNKTGREPGVRAEAGVLAGPRAGVAYALIVCFDDLSISHRLRGHEVFRTLGIELMEYVH